MILFVDMEHESGYEASFGEMILAGRTRITYRLQDLSGHTCLLQRYSDVNPKLITDYDIQAVFLSGNGTDWADYDPAQQEGLREVIRQRTVPIFGFCGGFQFIAETLGTPIERIGEFAEGETDPVPHYAPGWKTEFGYLPIDVENHPLNDGLGHAPIMRQAHSFEIKQAPEGFSTFGSTDTTPIQIIVSEPAPSSTDASSTDTSSSRALIVGTQFHPEYWTAENPDGKQMIANFCSMAGL